MLQDVEARRATEIDFLNGAIVAFGDRHARRHAAQPCTDRADQGNGGDLEMTSQQEIERRYANVREAAARDGLDAVVVAGSEYTGFEGAVRYLSGFRILHRYAYVVLPVEGEPSVVFPKEARWVGDHSEAWIEDKVFAEHPGQWIADRGFERDRRLRPRLRDAGARLPPDRRRRRGLGRGLRPRAGGEERGGARVGAGELPDQRGRRPRGGGRLRGREDRGGADGRRRAGLHRGRHLPDDDGHGPDRRERRRRAGVQVPVAAPDRRRRPAPLRPRDRRAGRPLGRVLTSDLRGASRTRRRSPPSTPTTSTSRRRRRR